MHYIILLLILLIVSTKSVYSDLAKSTQSLSPHDTTQIEKQKENERIVELEDMAVRVQSSPKNLIGSTGIHFSRDDLLNSAAGTGDDLNRIIANTPSVTSVGTLDDNALIVRGGDSHENVYVIDGIEVSTINHFATLNMSAGGIGFLNVNLIKNIDFYPGSAPVFYPSRTSSVVGITLRDGLLDGQNTNANVSISGCGIVTEGYLQKKVSSYLVNGRYMNMRLVDRLVSLEQGVPQYGDAFVKLSCKSNNNQEVSMLGLISYDIFSSDALWEKEGIPTVFKKNLFQALGGITSRFTSGYLQNQVGLYFTRFSDKFTTQYEQNYGYKTVLKSGSDSSSEPPVFISAFHQNNATLSNDVSIQKMWFDRIKLGSTMTYTHYDLMRGVNTDTKDTATKGIVFGAYFHTEKVLGLMKVTTGVRSDYFSMLNTYGFSPNVSLFVAALPLGSFTCNWNMSYQLPSDFNYMLISFLTSDSHIPVRIKDIVLQRCMQYSLKYERAFSQGAYQFSIEGFDKLYSSLYPYLFPNIKLYDFYLEDNNDKVVWRLSAPQGKKRAYGLELQFSKKIADPLYYKLGACFSSVRNQYADGKWYSDNNDIQKMFSFTLGTAISNHHSLSLRFNASAGRPFDDWPFVETTQYFKNHLDPVFSLNCRYSFTHTVNHASINGYIEALNLLNQTQIVDKLWEGRFYYNRKMSGFIPLCGVDVTF